MEVVGAEDRDGFRLGRCYGGHYFGDCMDKRWKYCNGIDETKGT